MTIWISCFNKKVNIKDCNTISVFKLLCHSDMFDTRRSSISICRTIHQICWQNVANKSQTSKLFVYLDENHTLYHACHVPNLLKIRPICSFLLTQELSKFFVKNVIYSKTTHQKYQRTRLKFHFLSKLLVTIPFKWFQTSR